MNLAKLAIDNKAVTYFALLLLITIGAASFFQLGQLEDPDFTIKTAVIVTPYPGASPKEVELEVSDRIELAIQEMPQVKFIRSFSKAGLSVVKVDIKPIYSSSEIPQIWDELRRKIRDTEGRLPPGTGRPDVVDDFGDVFGFQLALTGDGFSYAELEAYAKDIKKELSLVEGVARVELWGVQKKAIYLDISRAQLSELGLSEENLTNTLQQQNLVVDAGSLDSQNRRLRIAPTGKFLDPAEIGDLAVRPTLLDSLRANTRSKRRVSNELIRIRDIGTIRRGYVEPSQNILRLNGAAAIGLSITNVSGANIVDVGRNIDKRLAELIEILPVGIEYERVHWQSDIVAEAIAGFLINFAEALAIVLVVLTLAMGWRMGIIIGAALIATILGSFIVMALSGIDLQRMSLGALIIALGMMVDNAIVVADGVAVRLQKGMEPNKAAEESAKGPSLPLLGATVVAVMAFFPIFLSKENAGEYCATLFSVVGISLMVSWLISITITPVMCIDLLRVPQGGEAGADPYDTRMFRSFRAALAAAIRVRWLTTGIAVALLVAAVLGFGNVKQLFFPDSSMAKFMIDYWAPEGTRIENVAGDLQAIERKLLEDERVTNVATYIGSGPPRFYLPVTPEDANPAYAQLIVNVNDYRQIDALAGELAPWFAKEVPQAVLPFRKFGVGPSNTWKLELRISGPAVADPAILRSLSEEFSRIVEASPYSDYVRTDWRQRVQNVVPLYSQERGRWANVTRSDLANATKQAFDGRAIGLYREQDDLLPIVLRYVEEERRNVGGLDIVPVHPANTTNTVPLSQVVDSLFLEWVDPLIWRRDRRRTITVQSNPLPNYTLTTLRQSVTAQFAAVELPPGYLVEWGGEYEDSVDSQKSLLPGIIPAAVIVVFIIVALFNAYRPPIVILMTVPFVAIGIVAGLLVFDTPFGFVALLGGMSLVGMMIKNAIVLLDQVNIELTAGKDRYTAVLDAAVSRLRPVLLAAGTTVLGVIPLLQDVFWIGLGVTIMAGLSFGTVLTMILLPVFYCMLYRAKAA